MVEETDLSPMGVGGEEEGDEGWGPHIPLKGMCIMM